MKFFGRKESGSDSEQFASLSPAQKFAKLQTEGGEVQEVVEAFMTNMKTLENGRLIGQADGGYNPAPDDARQAEIYRFTEGKLTELGYPVTENDLDAFIDIPANDDQEGMSDEDDGEEPVVRSVA